MKPTQSIDRSSDDTHRLSAWQGVVFRTSVVALLAIILVGCSSGPTASEQAGEEVTALGDALAEAVILSYESSRGGAEPEAGTDAVNAARALTLQLSETSEMLDGGARVQSLGLVELANRAIVWVGQSEYERAEKLRLEEFLPAAEQFNATLLASQSEPAVAVVATSWSTGKAIGLLSTIASIGVLLYVRYRRGDVPDPVVEARKRKAERLGQPTEPIERKWSDITPLVAGPDPDEEPAAEPAQVRSPNARSIAVDLRGLLMTALHQVKDYGWDMSIVCPEVQITADPVKLRQAVLGALGHAFMGGAQRAGIVVEDLDGDVLLTIGRDTPPSQADADRAAEKFTSQVRQALGADKVDSSVITDDDVLLLSVSLGRKVGADEVSEPVA